MCGRLLFLSWSFSTVLPEAISPCSVAAVCLKVESGRSLHGSMAEEIVFCVVRSMRCSNEGRMHRCACASHAVLDDDSWDRRLRSPGCHDSNEIQIKQGRSKCASLSQAVGDMDGVRERARNANTSLHTLV